MHSSYPPSVRRVRFRGLQANVRPFQGQAPAESSIPGQAAKAAAASYGAATWSAALRTVLKMPAVFVLHSFRHTFGTRLGETGADVFTIMRLMGHSTVTVSQRYVHPSPEAMESAVSRMEAWNAARLLGVGTNLGTITEADSAKNIQVV